VRSCNGRVWLTAVAASRSRRRRRPFSRGVVPFLQIRRGAQGMDPGPLGRSLDRRCWVPLGAVASGLLNCAMVWLVTDRKQGGSHGRAAHRRSPALARRNRVGARLEWCRFGWPLGQGHYGSKIGAPRITAVTRRRQIVSTREGLLSAGEGRFEQAGRGRRTVGYRPGVAALIRDEG